MAAVAGAKRGREEDIPIEKSVSEFITFYDNINNILKDGNSENTYSKNVSDYMGENYAGKFENGFESHSDVFSKKVIRTNERFFNIMYYLINKRLHTVNLRRIGREIPIKWVNFKVGKNGLVTNNNEINTYLKRGNKSAWFMNDTNLFKDDDEKITFKYNGSNFEFKLGDRTLFIYFNKKINTKENIDNSLRVETQINIIIDELEKADGERDENKIIDNFKSIIGRLAEDYSDL